MRYLTIQRNKSFVGCLMKLKIYIEDMTSTEINIQGTPCRKIGEIKNGEQQTYMIGDEKLRIYVIADKLSKNYCSDFYEVPAGTENVFLSGSCKYNPLNGNAFRFDGATTQEMQYRRKKANKKGIKILLISLVIGFVIGLFASVLPLFATPEEKVFTVSNMSITLNDEFEEIQSDGFDAIYGTNDVGIYVISEKHEDLAPVCEDIEIKNLTLYEYIDMVIDTNGSDAEVKEKDGLIYFEYDGAPAQDGRVYHYVAFVYKADDGFYLIQFATLTEAFSEYEEDIFTYAKSVTFN